MFKLRESNAAAVSAMIHHYNDASVQTYPTSQLRDLAVAVETSFLAFTGRRTGRTEMVNVPNFAKRLAPVLESFDAAFTDLSAVPGSEEQRQVQRIREKVKDANLQSPQQELFAMLESLDIGFDGSDRKLMSSYRNGILHSGFVGDESNLAML